MWVFSIQIMSLAKTMRVVDPVLRNITDEISKKEYTELSQLEKPLKIDFENPIKIVPKDNWGEERIYRNDDICVKILEIDKGKNLSLQYHPGSKEKKGKEEVFMAYKGTVYTLFFPPKPELAYMKTPKKVEGSLICPSLENLMVLDQEEKFQVKLELPFNSVHQLYSENGGSIVELSTKFEKDSTERIDFGLHNNFLSLVFQKKIQFLQKQALDELLS